MFFFFPAEEPEILAGQRATLFIAGVSKWELVFLRPGAKTTFLVSSLS